MIDVEALKAKVDLTALVGHFVKLEKAGTEWKGLCPFHADKNPSFYVSPVKGFCHCFACGANHDAISFVQEIQGTDFNGAVAYLDSNPPLMPQLSKPERPPLPDRVTSKPPPDAGKPDMFIKKLGDPSMVWEYKDTDGGTLGYIARYETEEGKEIRCWSWGSRGSEKPAWGCGHFSKPRPLYRLSEINSRPQAPICMVEGEKSCDAAQILLPGYVASAWPGGANAWKCVDLTVLRGKIVLLWPDCDKKRVENERQARQFGVNVGDLIPHDEQPGIKAMLGLAQVLSDPKGLACTVRIIDPWKDCDLPDGWDAADFTGTTEELIAWAKPRASDYTHKSVELSTDQTGASPDSGDFERDRMPAQTDATDLAPDHSSAAPLPNGGPPPFPVVAPSLDPMDANTASPSDDQPPPYTEAPPPEGSTPSKPARVRPRLASVDGNAVPKPAIEDDPDLPAALTENGSAARFAALHKDDFRCVHEWNDGRHGATWLAWDGLRWKREPTRLTAMQQAKLFAVGLEYQSEAAALTRASKDKFNTQKYITAFLQLSQFDKHFVVPAAVFDADPLLLGTPGGTVDLRTGMLIPAQREHHITRLTSVEPVEGEHPLFDQVIGFASNGETKIADYLWRMLGYWLTGSCQEEQFTFLRGDEGSGKGTLVKAAADILGEYATVSDMEAFTESRDQKAPQHRAKLEGYRFTYASETNQNRIWNEAQINYMTGRDKVEGQRLWENKRDFEMTAKILIYGNYIPRLRSGIAVGLKRRLHLIEYHSKITEPDPTFKDRLRAEYPAILFEMIQGCLDWQKQGGLAKPEEISSNVSNYLSDQDYMNGWIEDCLEAIPGNSVMSRELYANFKHWCTANNQTCPPSGEFSKRLIARGWNNKHTKAGSAFTGWKIKPSDNDDRNPPASYYND